MALVARLDEKYIVWSSIFQPHKNRAEPHHYLNKCLGWVLMANVLACHIGGVYITEVRIDVDDMKTWLGWNGWRELRDKGSSRLGVIGLCARSIKYNYSARDGT